MTEWFFKMAKKAENDKKNLKNARKMSKTQKFDFQGPWAAQSELAHHSGLFSPIALAGDLRWSVSTPDLQELILSRETKIW